VLVRIWILSKNPSPPKPMVSVVVSGEALV
jgi:hypothetical protein